MFNVWKYDRGSGAAAFSPLDLFTGGRQGMWYDPSDLTTLFQAVGGTGAVASDADPVGYIEDKSGNSHEATRTGDDTRRALYKTSGGLHWLEFDGTDDNYDCLTAVGTFKNIGYVTIIAGVLPTDTAATKTLFFASTNGNNGSSRINVRSSGTELYTIGGRRLDGDSGSFTDSAGALSTATPQVITAQFKYASSDLIGRVDGVQVISNTSFQTDGVTTNLDSLAVRFGSLGNDNEDWAGRCYGLIVVVADLSAQEISDAEAWMADKCGI
jgi:hypothetical protein